MFLFLFLQQNGIHTDGSDDLTVHINVSERVLGNNNALIDEDIEDNDNTEHKLLVIK